MKDKCKKFESLFIFSDDESLKNHAKECEDCKFELEKFDKISGLIQEARPLYFKEISRKKAHFKTACAIFLLVLTGTTFSLLNTNNNLVDTIKYGQTLSAEDYGFPVDSYGLIMVDE